MLIPRERNERERGGSFLKTEAEDSGSGCQTGKDGQEIPVPPPPPRCNNAFSVASDVFSLLRSEVRHLKAGVTLSHKCLAGVEENLAALHDHALDCQVLPDVFGLANLVVHDSGEKKDILSFFFELYRAAQNQTYWILL